MNAAGPAPAPLDRAQLEAAVTAASRAPSILNAQPWQFRAEGDVIDVFAVPERSPAVLDPSGRETFLSLGAALLNLRLAVSAAGRMPGMQFLPSPDDRTHAARIRIGGPGVISDLERPLYEAIATRRSSRLPFTDERVPEEVFAHLQDAAAAEGGWLDPATGLHRVAVLEVLHEADGVQRADPVLVREVRRWTGERDHPDIGIPPDSLGPRPRNPSATVRDMTLGSARDRPSAQFENSGLLAVLLTTGDTPADWLRGGLALERVLLTASSMGLSCGILSHGTEVVSLRPLVRDPSSRWRFPQLVLRLGHGPDVAATPRLPLSDVFEFVG